MLDAVITGRSPLQVAALPPQRQAGDRRQVAAVDEHRLALAQLHQPLSRDLRRPTLVRRRGDVWPESAVARPRGRRGDLLVEELLDVAAGLGVLHRPEDQLAQQVAE